MLRKAKLLALAASSRLGISALILRSGWRRRRLLILCYHGISTSDEHEWEPGLYLPPELFRARLERLRRLKCNVLPLDEAVRRLYAGDLPPRSVAITFDDGAHDFYTKAWPIIREFGFPVTVYLTTWYSQFGGPVFDTMCSYLLWKARGRSAAFPPLWNEPILLDEAGRGKAIAAIWEHMIRERLSGVQKDELLSKLAAALGIDYADLRARRVLHLITPEEAAEMAHEGLDIQLHTHRHRLSKRQERVAREIEENREIIQAISHRPARHFCYPGGFHLPPFPEWLAGVGVESATTCETGIADPQSNPRLLPRLLDATGLSDREFDAWVTGVAAFLPQRSVPMTNQLFEDERNQATASVFSVPG